MKDIDWKGLAVAIAAVGGLITSMASAWQGCNTRAVQEQHAGEIKENKQAIGSIEKKADVAEAKADIAKDKAVIVEGKVEKIEKERKTDK